MEDVERVRGCERPRQLWIERAPPRQPDDVVETPDSGLAAAGDGCWVPPSPHELTLRRNPDAADS